MKACVIELDNSVFNFEGLSIKDEDYVITKKYPDGGDYTVWFNLCRVTEHKCQDKNSIDYANSINQNNTCTHLSGAKESDQLVFLQDPGIPEYGVNVRMVNGNSCPTLTAAGEE